MLHPFVECRRSVHNYVYPLSVRFDSTNECVRERKFAMKLIDHIAFGGGGDGHTAYTVRCVVHRKVKQIIFGFVIHLILRIWIPNEIRSPFR